MSTWHVGLSVPLKQIFIALSAAALPATHPKIGEFTHDDSGSLDTLDGAVSHAIYSHVQELVYHRSDTVQNTAAFFPENITDLQKYAIITDTFTKVTGLTVAGDVEVSVANNTDLKSELTLAPVNAYNRELTVTTTDAQVATAWVKPGWTGGKTELVIRGHNKGKATIVVTSMDGYFEAKKEVTVY